MCIFGVFGELIFFSLLLLCFYLISVREARGRVYFWGVRRTYFFFAIAALLLFDFYEFSPHLYAHPRRITLSLASIHRGKFEIILPTVPTTPPRARRLVGIR